MISNILANMPRYQLSFYKIPRSVMKKIISVQRKFLGNGVWNKNSISWISWKDVCKTKEEGGLGIRHVGRYNKALLSKWPRRILNEENEIWRGILRGRYKDVNKRLWGCDTTKAIANESL